MLTRLSLSTPDFTFRLFSSLEQNRQYARNLSRKAAKLYTCYHPLRNKINLRCTVPLKSKLPPSCEMRILSRETKVSSCEKWDENGNLILSSTVTCKLAIFCIHVEENPLAYSVFLHKLHVYCDFCTKIWFGKKQNKKGLSDALAHRPNHGTYTKQYITPLDPHKEDCDPVKSTPWMGC